MWKRKGTINLLSARSANHKKEKNVEMATVCLRIFSPT
jgi:ribosomal protein L28